MTEDNQDPAIEQRLQSYRTPPPMPGDEIWARIVAAERESTIRGVQRRWLQGPTLWVGGVAAAVLIFAAGVSVGSQRARATGKVASNASITSQPGVDPAPVAHVDQRVTWF